MGLPFYGRTFVTSLDGNFDDILNDHTFQGAYTKQDGFMGYNEICTLLSNKSSNWEKTFNTEYSEVIAKYRDVKKNETRVAVFDSSRSIANKMKFAMSRNLAGAMVW